MLSKLSVRKPYTIVVGIVLILILGVVSFTNMTVDLLPSMNLPYALVMTAYPGASPEEVEEIVTRPVEQVMATVSNISSIQSVSSENTSTVILEFDQTANMDSVTIEMRESLDQISGYWPDGVGSPLIMKLNPDMMPVLITAVSAQGADVAQVSKTIEEDVIPEIESVEGVASVTATGTVEETVEITLNAQKVDALSDEIKAEMEAQMNEARAALDEAKAQVESGKNALASGKAQAAQGLSEAEAQISVKSEELKQAQLEITEKMAELNVSETQLSQQIALIQTGRQTAEAQLAELEQAKQAYDEAKAALEAGAGMLTPEQEAELQAIIDGLQNTVDGYDAAKAVLEASIAQLAEQEAQLEAAAGLGDASAQLAAGESAIQMQEAQIDAAKEQAGASTDVGSLLSVDTIRTILTAQNFRMPAGYVTEEGLDFLVRVGDKFKNIDELKELVLLDMEGIDPVKLTDVASVELVNDVDEMYAKINGEPGVMLTIQKQTGYSTGDVSDRVLERLGQIEKDNEDISAVTLMDQGIYIDLIVNSVLHNLIYGAVLAIIVLLLFLKSFRSTFVIACSIPISIMAAIVAMYFSGVTLNVISLSGLALGVGMLVDNSIVVIENIYRMRVEEGASGKEAAIVGARQVGGAIMASTLTTVCVFLPIVFTKGITRQLFVDMGLTIAYSLFASLLVALTVVPMMSAGLLKRAQKGESRLYIKIKDGYGKLLARALHMKIPVLLGTLVLFIASIFLAASRGTEFMPPMESTQVSIVLETEEGTSLEDTAKEADKIMERVGAIEDVEDIGALAASGDMFGMEPAANQVQFYAITKEEPRLSNQELKKEIEKCTEDINGEITVDMSNMDMSALGSSGINIQIRGRDLDRLQEIAADIKEIIEKTEGTQNVSDGTEDNTEELRVVVDKAKATSHGLTVAQVYQELYKKLSEAQPSTALGTDTGDYDIYVKDGANEAMTRDDVRNMSFTVAKQDGTSEEVRLADVAAFEDGSGLQSINRISQSRYISVTAEIQEGSNIGLVAGRIQEELDRYNIPEGYEVKMTGEDETINEAMIELFKMLALALVFMYLIMVAQFQSLKSPFIIMFTVPLAFTGGLLALWMCGMPVSVIAMIGFVMLSGIIVNNGIVFIDYTNQLIAEGKEKRDALVEAGKTRLRPIIMTALTTILGLSTMAAGFGMGSDMVQPMAVVTIGGLIYGTILTLVVVPCIFDLFHRRKTND